jgi:hypothetical protein
MPDPLAGTAPVVTQPDDRLGLQGIDPADLDDERLLGELESIHRTRHDTLLHGTMASLAHHSDRMAALETEYLRRFPLRDVHPRRTAGAAAGSEGFD